MPTAIQQTVKNYRNAFGYAPGPGFPSRWPAQTIIRRGGGRRNFAGPIYSPAVAHGLGDGEGLGGWLSDALSAAGSAAGATGSALLAPAQAKLDQLEIAIKSILVLSGIAAATGVVSFLRGR